MEAARVMGEMLTGAGNAVNQTTGSNMKKKVLLGAAIGCACMGAAAQESVPKADELLFKPAVEARKTTVGVSVDASILLGVGLSVGLPLPNNFNVRGVYHGLSIDEEIEDDGGNYEGEIRLRTFGALADWHPFGGAFRLTAGIKSNGNEINLSGIANDSNEFEIGDCAYNSNPADPLRVNGKVDFRSSAPYFGIGWGGNLNAEPGFYGVFDIGVMFSGSPNAALSASGSATVANNPNNGSECGAPGTPRNASDPQLQQELRDAENDANEEAKDFKLWPNIAFGIGWRF
jgi:hypothetical protein